MRDDEAQNFDHAVHERYDGLNDFERRFAEGLDRTGMSWARNPSRTGYGIPLISPGTTSSFYPDFLIWDGPHVFAVDTTGGHLLPEKAARKLLAIRAPDGAEQRIHIRFVSEGTWTPALAQEDAQGFTVWELGPTGERRAIHVSDIDAAVARSIKAPS